MQVKSLCPYIISLALDDLIKKKKQENKVKQKPNLGLSKISEIEEKDGRVEGVQWYIVKGCLYYDSVNCDNIYFKFEIVSIK